MPSPLEVPSVDELARAFRAGVKVKDKRADVHVGSNIDRVGGAMAILWSRMGVYERDLWRSIYFDTAAGDDLTNRGSQLEGVDRYLDARGAGTMLLQRAAGGIVDTVYVGTRIRVPGSIARIYRATATVNAASADLSMSVPIEAIETGPGYAIDIADLSPIIDDPLKDSTWQVARLTCSDGTRFEPQQDYRARARSNRRLRRVGYRDRIIQALKDAGCANVALFAHNYSSADLGWSVAYVGDQGFTGTNALVRASTAALESVRVCGAELPVRKMTAQALAVDVTVNLWDTPRVFDLQSLRQRIAQGMVYYFKGVESGFAYRIDAMRGRVAKVSKDIQNATFNSPTVDISILSGSPSNWPVTLTRYTLAPTDVTISFQGPQ